MKFWGCGAVKNSASNHSVILLVVSKRPSVLCALILIATMAFIYMCKLQHASGVKRSVIPSVCVLHRDGKARLLRIEGQHFDVT